MISEHNLMGVDLLKVLQRFTLNKLPRAIESAEVTLEEAVVHEGVLNTMQEVINLVASMAPAPFGE